MKRYMKVKINRSGFKIIIFSILLTLILLVVYLFRTGNIIYVRKPIIFFQPVIPEYLAEFPVFEDCLISSHEPFNELETGNSKPENLEEDKIRSDFNILTRLTLRDGFELGRVRKIVYTIPGPVFCENWFYLTVRKKDTKNILKGEDRINAFVVNSEEDLKNLAILLYGEPNNEHFDKKYKSWLSLKACSKDKSMDCANRYSEFPKSVYDGQITNEYEKKTLHRFTLNGISTYTLSHKTLTIEEGGYVNINSVDLISYQSGIIY